MSSFGCEQNNKISLLLVWFNPKIACTWLFCTYFKWRPVRYCVIIELAARVNYTFKSMPKLRSTLLASLRWEPYSTAFFFWLFLNYSRKILQLKMTLVISNVMSSTQSRLHFLSVRQVQHQILRDVLALAPVEYTIFKQGGTKKKQKQTAIVDFT